jgi:transitional endoplasmic reticulum ATPase
MANDINNAAIIGTIFALIGDEAKQAFEAEAWRHRDTDIEYEGKKIRLPGDPKVMPLEAAIETLQRKLKDENTYLDLIEQIEGYPFDAAVAFLKAMKDTYGWASPVPTPGFWGDKNPDLMTVNIGPDPEDTLQVPMGSFLIPGIENRITVHIAPPGEHGRNRHPTLCIHSKARKREQHILKELVAKAKRILAEASIYKGKAIRLNIDDNGRIQRELQPIFIQTKHIATEELIFSRTVQDQLDVSLFTPIRHTAECLKHGIPLKRGVLLEGKYGVGKSMTATIASRVCVEHGWTFILVDKVQGLREALEFATAYQPALVFAEDIDRQISDRNEQANDLLNVISGVISASSKIITVLSTNHVERINQAMLRPGRLDAVISILPPDADAVSRLIRLYARNLIGNDEPLDRVSAQLAGQIPATIREVCERAKLAMINGSRTRIIEDDLVVAAEGMVAHLNLLNRPEGQTFSAAERLGTAMAELIGGGGGSSSNADVLDKIEDIEGTVDNTYQRLGRVADRVSEIYDNMDGSNSNSNGHDYGDKLEAIEKTMKVVNLKLSKIEKATANS